MKLKNIFLPMLAAFACMAMTTGCDSDDDNWSPGPKAENEYQVYFTSQSEDVGEVDKGKSVDFTVTIAREDASKAASVPITVTSNSELFEVPGTVDFAEGETEKTFNVHFKGTEQVDDYECQLSIDDAAFSSPYTSFPTSVTLKLMVATWEVISESVHFAPYYKYTPDFDAQLLKLEGKEKYRIKNFMANYDLTFTLKEFANSDYYYIIPEGGYYAADWFEWDTSAWHMGDDGDNTWPLYYNGDTTGNYYAWCFLFCGDQSTYGRYTYINFKDKLGCIFWGFYYYDTSDNLLDCQGDYIYFNWE